ncbi:MAG: hypothetical protein EOO01_11000 [Chitinophagaceae bacterium]|nr:MAG: hypothetical protein EOO01_11000 [Chitinophagaceae bacterium]
MQIIKSLTKLALFLLPFTASSQATYIPQGSKEYHMIDRLQIKQMKNTNLNFSAVKPFNRKYVVQEIEFLDSARRGYMDSLGADRFSSWTDFNLTSIDEYNIRRILMNSSEWVTGSKADFESRKPILKYFYETKANMLEVNTPDFFLAVNPVLQLNLSFEKGNDQQVYLNSRGLTARGRIANKIGFSATVTDNQERGPAYFSQLVRQLRAVPGNGFFKSFKKDSTAVDYFDARGYITFNAAKFIDFQAGYDKNFIGNGYRSLFLSDFGSANLFFKVNTRIWKLNYQNLFMELMPQFVKNGDSLLPRKYAAMHHLSMNVTKWLNVGLFEGVIFGRTNRFDFQYLNPLIFYRHIEGTVGSPDNAVAGIDFKANVAHRGQLYGQLLLDEFILKNVRNKPTSWTNKFGFQLGGKYVDAFGVKNLDLQVEMNRVRPFTYSHNNIVGNYTHYNQPLAHPLGSNFQEFIGIARYQPAPKWYIMGRAIYYYKGFDTSGINFGSDIFRNYLTRSFDEGFKVGSGQKAKVFNGILDVTYELRENLFLDLSFQQRFFKMDGIAEQRSTMVTGGIRLNMFKRSYDY